MKNAEGFFPSLPARSSRGESWREGKLIKNGLLSPALSSFFGGEGEGKRWCAPSKLLAEQKWSQTRAPEIPRRAFDVFLQLGSGYIVLRSAAAAAARVGPLAAPMSSHEPYPLIPSFSPSVGAGAR